MSIIYGTLERLEHEEAQPLIAPLAGAATEKTAVFLKPIVMGLVGAGMGIALALWLQAGDSSGPDRTAPRLGPVKVQTALVAEPAVVEVPQVPAQLPELREITVEKTRLVPREFPAPVKPAPPPEEVVAAAAPAAAPVPAPVAIAVVAPAPVEDSVGPVIDRARVALSRGDYGLALATLAELEKTPEERSEYWFIKGSAHLGLGQLEPAEAALSAARALSPQSAQVVVQLSILHQEKGEHALAVDMLGDAARQHPGVPEIYLNLGYSQLALGADAEARVSFRVFLELTRDSAFYASQRVAVTQWLGRTPGLRVAGGAG